MSGKDILIGDDEVKSFLMKSKGFIGDDFFMASRDVISYFARNYHDRSFPAIFQQLYMVAYLNLLRGFGSDGFSTQRFYILTSLLLTEWGGTDPDNDKLIAAFYVPRPRLSARNAQWLVRNEISLVEQTIKNAKAVADYEVVRNYIKEVKDYDSRLGELRNIKQDADKLKGVLNKYTEAFNFVGLYKGFSDLRKRKEREKNFRLCFLFALGVAALAPLIAKVYVSLTVSSNVAVSEPVNVPAESLSPLGGLSFSSLNVDVSAALSFVGLELLILYFFRVTLHSLKSVRAQLLQIDLRMTLCQFIDKYAEYAQGKGDALKGFESVIFSGLVSVEDKLPATFDGFDVLQGIAEKLGRK